MSRRTDALDEGKSDYKGSCDYNISRARLNGRWGFGSPFPYVAQAGSEEGVTAGRGEGG
jgi:hypothetical protein